jgi:hypothetical protein
VTCGPLEGVLACLCKSLTSESLIMEAQGHLDLHLGNGAHRMDIAPPLLGQLDEGSCLWRHFNVPWR